MGSEIENEKFVRFKTSVETSLKSFAQKLGESLKDIRKQIKEIKEDLNNRENKECVNCSCRDKYENLETAVELVETKVHTLEEKLPDNCDHSNNLDSEIHKLQEMAKINIQKIEDIDSKIQILESQQYEKRIEIYKASTSHPEKIECSHCGVEFRQYETLKKHIKHQHQRIFNCSDCEINFNNSYELEQHMVNDHKKQKPYKCDVCQLSFIMKWRFDKHVVVHQNTKIRRCHYFNNKKECPFMKSGCKYLHEISVACKYSDLCTKAMCQYRH